MGQNPSAHPQTCLLSTLLAAQHMLLGAHALGLGTCLIGFAVSAMAHEPRLKDFLGIHRSESIYAVIAFL
jgi:nitroreductase